MLRNKIWAVILLAFGLLWVSCADDDSIYKIGDQFVKQESKLHFVDTLTIKATSVLIDSFVTSGYNTAFVGYNIDDNLGTIEAESYFPFTFNEESIPKLDSTATFDSLVLYIKQSGGYSGDTMTDKSIAVYRVLETIKPHDENNSLLYNTDTFALSAQPYATHTFRQRPAVKWSETIRLPDSLGKSWFDMMVVKKRVHIINEEGDTDEFTGISDTLSSADKFMDYFYGFCIRPITKNMSWSSNFYGLDNTQSSSSTAVSNSELQIRLYYRLKNQEENEFVAWMPPTTNNYSFISFKPNRTGSLIEHIDNSGIPSEETDNKMFIQAGGKIGFRIDIPLINRLKEIDPNMSVMSAHLLIKPALGSFKKASDLPTIKVYWIDKDNNVKNQLMDIKGQNGVISTLVSDNEVLENTYYSFDILSYVLYKIDNGLSSDESLFFTFSDEFGATSFDQLVLENQSVNDALKIQMNYVVY